MTGSESALILLADGDEDCRVMYAQVLRYFGYRVVLAETCGEAFALAERACPALAILETHLCDGEGADAAVRIRGHCGPTLPIIGISARLLPDQLGRVPSGRFSRLLSKPVAPRVLADLVGELLREQRPTPVK